MLKQRLKRPLKNIYYSILLILNYFYDYKRYSKYYAKDNQKNKTKEQLEAWILQDKHRIEKAFSLPTPRPSFGKDPLYRLVHNTKEYESRYGKSKIYFISLGAIKAYKKFHEDNQYELPSFYNELVILLDSDDFSAPETELSGYYSYNPEDNTNIEQFMRSRHSFRNFSSDKITLDTLKHIVSLSTTAPSVCNRQHWKIHFFEGDKKLEVLKLQNGNTGFTDNIPMIAVVTSNLSAFYTPGERNQPYTDGGIFAMNLMYSIEAVGLKSCPLNWCNSSKYEKKLHNLGYIPESEAVVVIIAFGYANNTSILAKSPRLDLDNFYKLH
ncbi:TPA: nitroreductase family protein [Providencia rettgeri]